MFRLLSTAYENDVPARIPLAPFDSTDDFCLPSVQVLAKKQAEKRSLDGLTAELDSLRALSRTYHGLLKQFRDECALNETLAGQQ